MIKRYLSIHSTDRKSGTPSNFYIDIKDGIKFSSCELLLAQIPNTYYNVTDNNNKININGSLKTVGPGNYNLDELFNVVRLLDDSISDVTFNDVTGVVTILTTGPINISFPSEGSLNFILGFPIEYNQTVDTHNSSFPPSLAKHVLYIDVDRFSSNHSSSLQYSTSFTFSVPNNVNKNDVISYNEKTNFKQAINCRNSNEIIYNVNIRIRDQYNQIVSGLSEWSCLLSFY